MTTRGNNICMCKNRNCLSRQLCHRYTVEPKSYAQSYANYYCHKGENKCEHFIDNTPTPPPEQPDVANIPAESQ